MGRMSIPVQISEPAVKKTGGGSLLALGFRPFFLAAGIFAVLFMAMFIFGVHTGVWHYSYFPLTLWHAHEMIFGYVVAVIAGFLLTAVKNWTGFDTATGYPLLALLFLWLAGRVVSAVPGLDAWIIILTDMAFLPVLALIVARPILKARQMRNLSAPALLLLLAVGNGLLYAEMLGLGDSMDGLGFSVAVILMLISLIAGRVMPFFVGRAIPSATIQKFPWIESLALPIIAIWAVVDLLLPGSLFSVITAAVAATLHAVRLYGWSCRGVWREPMLWVIYLAYGWLVAGFLLSALADLEVASKLLVLHGWTVGSIGMFTLGMMARVALGHTGRPVSARPAMVWAFLLLAVASLIRVLIPLLFPAVEEAALLISAAGWILAFATFVWIYAPYLIQSRADGAQG